MKGAPTRAEGQVMTYREAIFAVVNAAAKVLALSIDQSFEKTRFGSRRNDFFRRNYNYFEELAQAPLAAATNEFSDTLKSFGLQTGQTIVAGLQAGIIDTSAVETAMQASLTSGVYGFMAFVVWSENKGSKAKYIRADIGNELLVMDATQPWATSDNVGVSPYVTAFIATTEGTGDNMNLVKFNVRGYNLKELVGNGKVTDTNNTELQGSWNEDGDTYTPTTPRKIPVGAAWNYVLKYKDIELSRTTVYGSSIDSGASGE